MARKKATAAHSQLVLPTPLHHLASMGLRLLCHVRLRRGPLESGWGQCSSVLQVQLPLPLFLQRLGSPMAGTEVEEAPSSASMQAGMSMHDRRVVIVCHFKSILATVTWISLVRLIVSKSTLSCPCKTFLLRTVPFFLAVVVVLYISLPLLLHSNCDDSSSCYLVLYMAGLDKGPRTSLFSSQISSQRCTTAAAFSLA